MIELFELLDALICYYYLRDLIFYYAKKFKTCLKLIKIFNSFDNGYNFYSMNIKKIFVVGAGYVGLANGLALAKKHKVVFIDNDQNKLRLIENQICPLKEKDLEDALLNFTDNISTSNSINIIEDDSLIILSLPTNYDEELSSFNTSTLESVIKQICDHGKNVTILIKSTIPIGFTKKMIDRHNNVKIYFSPEFLREGKSYKDATYPERIIISPVNKNSKIVANILCSVTPDFNSNNLLIMDTNEAESVKLFSNTYLAMRVAFINEIDSYCEVKNLNSIDVINGICKDSRIGDGYNNPSFGYGGSCFPKDTKQALSAFQNIPESIISGVVESNEKRANFIANNILKTKKRVIGFYRLNMKSGSDNIRNSSSIKILKILLDHDVQIIVYEPLDTNIELLSHQKISLTNDLNFFSKNSEIIIANRLTSELEKLENTIYTRDLFYEN